MNEQKGWPRNLSTGPKGGHSKDPGGGLSTGPTPCYLTIPPWHIFVHEVEKRGMKNYADLIRKKRPDV